MILAQARMLMDSEIYTDKQELRLQLGEMGYERGDCAAHLRAANPKAVEQTHYIGSRLQPLLVLTKWQSPCQLLMPA